MELAALSHGFDPVVPDLRFDIYRSEEWTSVFAADVLGGLSRRPMSLPPKYFYDERGSELFEQITGLEEYYPTRVERSILAESGQRIAELTEASDLIELGSGSSNKTELLLGPLRDVGSLERYVPIDVSESAVRGAAVRLVSDYPGLRIHAVIGDFERHLGGLPEGENRLFAFLGGTVGNFTPNRLKFFFRRISHLLGADDSMLVGLDLVKDVTTIEAAYDDSAGITAAFNKNVLSVINANLLGTFDLDAFEHSAFYDPDNAWIEMRLRARVAHTARVGALDLNIDFEPGDEILTEISRKFTREGFADEVTAAGLEVTEWFTDPDQRFALALLRSAGTRD